MVVYVDTLRVTRFYSTIDGSGHLAIIHFNI